LGLLCDKKYFSDDIEYPDFQNDLQPIFNRGLKPNPPKEAFVSVVKLDPTPILTPSPPPVAVDMVPKVPVVDRGSKQQALEKYVTL
jgi:hypothetical protein